MVEGFDKEIDFLLRQTAQGETAVEAQIPDSRFQIIDSNHLDADEISAFAENALPEKVRRNYMTHLADCARCRKSLANLIALNGDFGSENIHAEKSVLTEIAAPKIPWYRTLFAVPNLAYAMGALILVFGAIGIFTVLQSNKSENSQVSQISEKQIGGKGMSSDGDAATQEVYRSNQMSSNTAAMNSATATNSAANASIAPMTAAPTAANSNAAVNKRESNQPLKEEARDDKTLSKPGRANEPTDSVAAGAPPAPPPATAPVSNDFTLDGQEERPAATPSSGSAAQNQATQNQTQITPDTRNVQRAPMPSAKARKQDAESDELKQTVKDKSDEKTVVGGRTFNRANNVWIDAAYRGQATMNVSRGTKEYKKLDSGLRGIVENLGGTVIIVWKEKAYRIQ